MLQDRTDGSPSRGTGARVLDAIERIGNRLPDPIAIFLVLIAALVALSVLGAALGWSVIHPVTGERILVESLVSGENLRTLLTDMPKTMTSFAPLGIVLLIMLGAGLAERTGLLGAAIRAVVRATPRALLTPAIVLMGLCANQAADAGFVILVPLAGVVFAAAGRHPIAGMAAAFAGCAGSYSGNPLPGQFDALILGLTEPAAQLLDPTWRASMVGNWWFSLAGAAILLPTGWWITERVIEPRLGPWTQAQTPEAPSDGAAALEAKGLRWAGVAALAVVGLWLCMALLPNAPLIDPSAVGPARWTPFLRSLTAGFFLFFLTTGIAYGAAVGTVRGEREVVGFTVASMASMAPYIVLAFVASHFIAMFSWSNLAAFTAIEGAGALKSSGLPVPLMLIGIVLITVVLDLFIGSASAKWAALAPVLVPMMMVLGVSPEMTTAVYRVGDTSVNMATPLMVYFPLVLAYCRRWIPDFGVGGLLAVMLPYSWAFTAGAVALTGLWAMFELSPGPGAMFGYVLGAG